MATCHWCGTQIPKEEEPCCDFSVECQQRMKDQWDALKRASERFVKASGALMDSLCLGRSDDNAHAEFMRSRITLNKMLGGRR